MVCACLTSFSVLWPWNFWGLGAKISLATGGDAEVDVCLSLVGFAQQDVVPAMLVCSLRVNQSKKESRMIQSNVWSAGNTRTQSFGKWCVVENHELLTYQIAEHSF